MANFTQNGTLNGTAMPNGALQGKVHIPDLAVKEVDIATETSLGVIMVGENLKITQEGVLSVDTANDVEQDNTKPITAAAVYTEIGNIDALLKTI